MTEPIATDAEPPGGTVHRLTAWFWRHQREVCLSWVVLGPLVRVAVLTTHLSLSLSYWEMTASSSALGACYLAVAARGIQPRRSVFAGLAIVAFGIAFNPHLNGIGPALLLASLPVMLVAVYIAFKALDDGHSEPL